MPDPNMTATAREWSSEDRRLVGWLAILPAAGSALFTLAVFATTPSVWPLAFVITAMGAYATAFIGVMPILFALRQRRWTRLVHYALAGFAGVLLPWLMVGACTELMSRGTVQLRIGEALMLAAGIGAAITAVYGWRVERKAAVAGEVAR
jgi:hypothetical protein